MSSLNNIVDYFVKYHDDRLAAFNATKLEPSDVKLFLKIVQFKKDGIIQGNNFKNSNYYHLNLTNKIIYKNSFRKGGNRVCQR